MAWSEERRGDSHFWAVGKVALLFSLFLGRKNLCRGLGNQKHALIGGPHERCVEKKKQPPQSRAAGQFRPRSQKNISTFAKKKTGGGWSKKKKKATRLKTRKSDTSHLQGI